VNAPTAPDAVEFGLVLEGMTCAACAARIEKSLNRLDGLRARVNLGSETAQIAFPPQGAATVEKLVDAVQCDSCVREAGAPPDNSAEHGRLFPQFLFAAVLPAPFPVEMVGMFTGAHHVSYDPARTGLPALRKTVGDAGRGAA
jgi:P-type Cu+ transporter